MTSRDLGIWGERTAVHYLQRAGFLVLTCNWRCRYGEIDIIASQGSTVVFVEVKTRSGLRFGYPSEAVTPMKLARLHTLAQMWLAQQSQRWMTVRFDVIAIVTKQGQRVLEHLEGV